jgi:hypothetical protein
LTIDAANGVRTLGENETVRRDTTLRMIRGFEIPGVRTAQQPLIPSG